MNLAEYFEKHQGIGVLATADCDGIVDLAVYAKPIVIDNNTIAFVMRERLTYRNLKTNPIAAYMFLEQGGEYHGKRLYLTKTREETNTSLIKELIKKQPEICPPNDDSNKYLVHFKIGNIWPLVGDGSI